MIAITIPRLPVVTSIARLASGASFETTACDLAGFERARDTLPAGSMLSVTWLPNDTHDDRIAGARVLRESGFEPIPHVAARRIRDGREADLLVRRLRDEAGVTRILLIGGDVANPAGEFRSALELLVRFRAANHGLQAIGFGGYPQGHPQIGAAALEAELDTKLAVAADAGLDPFVVTQFTFEAKSIVSWLEAFRARGNDVPVRIGLAGPATIGTLMRFARICGVRSSTRGLIRNGASLARMLLQEAGPDQIIRGLAEAGIRERLGPIALHLFPFGGLERAARWIAPVSQGRVRLRWNDAGFEPEL